MRVASQIVLQLPANTAAHLRSLFRAPYEQHLPRICANMFTIERAKIPARLTTPSSPAPSVISKVSSATTASARHVARSPRVVPTRHASPFQLPPSLDPFSKHTTSTPLHAETTPVLPDSGVASGWPAPSTRVPTTVGHARPPPAAAERSTRVVQALLKDEEPLREPDAHRHTGEPTRTPLESDRITRAPSLIPRSDTSPPAHIRQDPTLPVASFTVEDADFACVGENSEFCSTSDKRTAPIANRLRDVGGTKPTPRTKTMRRVRFVSLSRKRREKQMECGKRVTDAMQIMDRDALTKLLTDSRLIRTNSKAPETVLRNIAQGVFLPDGSSGC